MGNIVTNMAFQPRLSTYNESISYLEFAVRKERSYSSEYTYEIPVRHYHRDHNIATMIVCHGNAEDIGQTDPIELSNQFNVNICLFDYAGYGMHSNKVSSESCCQKDVITVYNHLIQNKGISPESIIIYGRSLGSGIATYLAHYLCIRQIPNKLILVSPLYSAANTVTNCYVPGDIFLNYKLAPQITSETLILHGNNDNVVPYNCGLNLSRLFPNLINFITLENCGHNDIFIDTYYTGIYNFINY